jgi:hypothetical protein
MKEVISFLKKLAENGNLRDFYGIYREKRARERDREREREAKLFYVP